MARKSHVFDEAKSGVLTVVNLSPIDVGYGLLMVSAFGLLYAPQGIAAAFIAVIVGNLVPALFGRSGMLFSGGRPAQTLLVAELLAHLFQAGNGTTSFSVIFAYAAVCTVMAGTIQMALGLLRAGSIIKYVPIPVLSGYINAVALLIVWPAVIIVLDFPRGTSLSDVWNGLSLQVFGNAGFGIFLLAVLAFVHTHYKKLHWSIAGLFGGTIIYYFFLGLSGSAHGSHLPEVDNLAPYWDGIYQLASGNFPVPIGSIVRTVLPYSLAIAVLNAMESLLASAVYEENSNIRCDANHVLIDQGVANMIGGMLGALPMAPSISRINIGWELGGRGFHALSIAAATCTCIMVFGGRFLSFVPMPIVGVLMMFLAWTMFDNWTRGQVRKLFASKGLEATLRKQVQTNIAIMVTVVVVAFSGHLIAAMFAGAMLAMFLFVRDYSQSVIGRTFSGAHRHSVLMRPEYEAAHLEAVGHCVRVIELNTPIVFGTADHLLDYLLRLPQTVRYLILDCHRVREIDDKGARIFVRLVKILSARGIHLHLAYIHPSGPRGSTLHDAGLTRTLPILNWHIDTDKALETVENELIAAVNLSAKAVSELRQLDIVSGLNPDEIGILHRHFMVESFAEKEPVFLRGHSGDRFYVVASGCVEIHLPLDDKSDVKRRLASFPPGVIFGEMAMLCGTNRSADAIAAVETSVWSLSTEALDDLRQHHPELASRLLLNMARQLSARLSVTNDELVYATRS